MGKRKQERQSVGTTGGSTESTTTPRDAVASSGLDHGEASAHQRDRAVAGLSPRRGRPWVHLVVAVLLVAATWRLYASDVELGFFTIDDSSYVTDNPWIRGPSSRNVTHVLTEPYFTMYAPTQLLSYMADYMVGGLDPRTFHRASNLWAALAAVLVYALGVALTGDALASALAAALFVAAPVHVEAVAWISSRKDLAATAFALLALYAHIHLRRARTRTRAAVYYLLALLCFALAVGAKQSVAVLPAVLLVYDVLIAKRRLVTVLADKVPYAIVAVLVTVPTIGALPATQSAPPVAQLVAALSANVWLLTGLAEQVIFRDPQAGAVAVVASLLLVLAGMALLFPFLVPFRVFRRVPALDRFLGLWVLIAIAPTLATALAARGGPGLFPVTDRYLFWASAPWVLLVATRAIAFGRRFGRPGVAVAAVLLLALGAFWTSRTLAYLAEWRDPRSVWLAATRKSNDVNVHLYLATHLVEATGRMDAARTLTPEMVRLADALSPGTSRGEALTREWNAGQQSRPETQMLRTSLRRLAWDELETADRVRGGRVLPNLYYTRGQFLLQDRDLVRARAEFERAYEQSQLHAWEEKRRSFAVLCHQAYGITAWQARDYPEALKWFRVAEDEQIRFGGNWVPDITKQRQRLEGIVAGTVR